MRIFTFLLVFFLSGCGYKPTSHLTRDIINDDVYVDVVIDKVDPKNSVWIKDSVKDGVVSRLSKKLRSDKNSNSHIIVSIKSITLLPLLYDEYGYASSYKAVLMLEFDTKFKDLTIQKIITSGEYDFAVSQKVKNVRYADSVLSDSQRYNAIREASKEAFNEYIAVLAMKGFKANVNKD
ncbi:MAG: LPS assembly lipoprotein LptE [Campylobacter sp.]